ncbi:MAG TPA: DUF72 domain-containing protein [Methylomirabilota bacterium]|nr:DUF72 domain-containing protein [Methylomirabilota bacterium]
MSFDRAKLAARLWHLAGLGVFLGASSWKYPGWFGFIYERDRYVKRGRFSAARFERHCLAEYAETFPAVSLDAAYYQFLKPQQIAELAAQVPAGFRFAPKVCADITLKRFPQLARFGARAGQLNAHFLDADLFADAFLAPWEAARSKVGLITFEFSRFGPGEFARGAAFVEALETFLGKLPRGWPYGVEIRNRQWLHPEYFAALARHGVTHIYNAWTDMPPVGEQLALPGSNTNPALLAGRFLLRERRTYEQAVKQFSPYDRIQDPNPEGRAAAADLVKRGWRSQGRTTVMVLVNNRFEGHAPGTIQAIVEQLATGA